MDMVYINLSYVNCHSSTIFTVTIFIPYGHWNWKILTWLSLWRIRMRSILFLMGKHFDANTLTGFYHHGLYPNVHQWRSSLILFLFVQAKQPRVPWLGPNMVSIDLMRDQRSLDDVNGTPKGWRDYRKTSYIWRTLVSNKIVEHSDVVGASPVGAAPTTSSFST